MSLTFVKLPVSVSDGKQEYVLLDLLLPYLWDDEVLLSMIQLIMKLRSTFVNQTRVSYLLASFFEEQPFSIFNMIYVCQQETQESLPLKTITIGNESFPLSDVECNTKELSMRLSVSLIKQYVKQKFCYPL